MFSRTSLSLMATGLVFCCASASHVVAQVPLVPPGNAPAPPSIKINLDKAVPLAIPQPKKELVPTKFNSQKLCGWIIKIPGNHPIATPAYCEGKLYFGGGYGSHEFYCLDAATGKVVWKYNTSDDGPSAAVVEDGCVAFNTESCTVFVLSAATGKLMWSEWLGDPLMSQPAVSKGKLYIAHPGGQRGGASGHQMLCANLKTGKHIWRKPIAADVISAPVIDGEKLCFTCMDGTSYCLNADSGATIWKKAHAGTSAPIIAKGKVIVAQKSVVNKKAFEGLQTLNASTGSHRKEIIAVDSAPYLVGATNGTIGPQAGDATRLHKLDSGVGFGGGAPSDAQMSKAVNNLGISTVAGAWGYQGAKSVARDSNLFNSQGVMVNSVDADKGTVRWRAKATGRIVTGETQVFSPPSLGKTGMYLCSGDGHLVAMDQKQGQVRYMYDTKRPISFQPALVGGNVFIGTADGEVLCINTGDTDADGWTAWGGNMQHNKQD